MQAKMAIGTDFTTWMDAVWQPTQMPQLVSCKARGHLKTCPTVANCFLMATPLSPHLRLMIKAVVRNVRGKFYPTETCASGQPLFVTGPGLFASEIAAAPGGRIKGGVLSLPCHLQKENRKIPPRLRNKRYALVFSTADDEGRYGQLQLAPGREYILFEANATVHDAAKKDGSSKKFPSYPALFRRRKIYA